MSFVTIITIRGAYFDHAQGEMKPAEREAWYRMAEAIGLRRADIAFTEYHPSTKGRLHARAIRKAIRRKAVA